MARLGGLRPIDPHFAVLHQLCRQGARFGDACKPKPLIEPLRFVDPSVPNAQSWLPFQEPPSASSAPQTANRDRRRPSAREARLAHAASADRRGVGDPCADDRGVWADHPCPRDAWSWAWDLRPRPPRHARRPCDACDAVAYPVQADRRPVPCAGDAKISSHFSAVGSTVEGAGGAARPSAAAASPACGGASSRGSSMATSAAPFDTYASRCSRVLGWGRRLDGLGAALTSGGTNLRSAQKPRDFNTWPSSPAEQPRIDIMSGVALNPPSPVAPFGGALGLAASGARSAAAGSGPPAAPACRLRPRAARKHGSQRRGRRPPGVAA